MPDEVYMISEGARKLLDEADEALGLSMEALLLLKRERDEARAERDQLAAFIGRAISLLGKRQFFAAKDVLGEAVKYLARGGARPSRATDQEGGPP